MIKAGNGGSHFPQSSSRPIRADPRLTSLAERFLRVGHLSFVAALREPFDYRAFSALLPSLPDIELVQCLTELEVAASVCKAVKPDGVIIGMSYADEAAFTIGGVLLKTGCIQTIAFFDIRFALWRAYKALATGDGSCYFTRDFEITDLCRCIRTGVGSNGNSFFSNPSDLTQFDSHGILTLTKKELTVVQWLARGHSVRGVAEKLGLSESTIDNHKSKAMKKLNIHRTHELIRIAMNVGLVEAH